jgi:hypothetical protein
LILQKATYLKYFLFYMVAAACFACGTAKEYPKAEDAMDAGREYVDACLKGDFERAAFYASADTKNAERLAATERAYRQKDKEGRQQLRNASINIMEVKNLSDSVVEMRYSNSYDRQTRTLRITRKNAGWRVDGATEN